MPKGGTIGGVVALVLALGGCSGSADSRHDDQPPVPVRNSLTDDSHPRAVRHEPLADTEREIRDALAGAAGGGAKPDYPRIAAAASRVAEDASGILEDAPASLRDEDRLRYEGLIAQLRERAVVLREAATAEEKLRVSRSFQQLTASCVKCHNQFGATTAGSER
jgi:hypothetical protein